MQCIHEQKKNRYANEKKKRVTKNHTAPKKKQYAILVEHNQLVAQLSKAI